MCAGASCAAAACVLINQSSSMPFPHNHDRHHDTPSCFLFLSSSLLLQHLDYPDQWHNPAGQHGNYGGNRQGQGSYQGGHGGYRGGHSGGYRGGQVCMCFDQSCLCSKFARCCQTSDVDPATQLRRVKVVAQDPTQHVSSLHEPCAAVSTTASCLYRCATSTGPRSVWLRIWTWPARPRTGPPPATGQLHSAAFSWPFQGHAWGHCLPCQESPGEKHC